MEILFYFLAAAIGAIIAVGTYIFVHKLLLKGQKDEIIQKAEIEAENIRKEKIFQAKEKFLQLKSEHEQYINEKNNQIHETESRLKQKENTLNQQNAELGRKNREADAIRENLKSQVDMVTKKAEEYDKLRAEAIQQIENIAGMTAAEAKNQLMENMKAEARSQAQSYINDVMDEARLTAGKEAKRIVDSGYFISLSPISVKTRDFKKLCTLPFLIESDKMTGKDGKDALEKLFSLVQEISKRDIKRELDQMKEVLF